MGKKASVRNGTRQPAHKTHHFNKKVFDEWPLKNGETVRVSTDNAGGYDLVHVRRWQPGPGGKLFPTEKGAAIGIGQLPRLLKALKAVRSHARKLGLLPPPAASR